MQKVRIGLVVVVTAVWVVGYSLAYSDHSSPPSETTALMAVVLTYAFGGEVRDALRRGKDDEDDKS